MNSPPSPTGKASKIVLYALAFIGVFALASIAILAIRGGTEHHATNVASSATVEHDPAAASSKQPAPTPCTIYKAGSHVQATVTSPQGGVTCQAAIKAWSQYGDFWTEDASQADQFAQGGGATVCDVVNQGSEISVYDVGSHMLGQRLCANLVAAGWTAAS